MLPSLAQIIPWLVQYRYVLLFPVMVAEGPIIAVIAGFLCSLGIFNLFIVYILSVVGDLVGDTLYYSLGRWGRDRINKRFARFLGITPERIKATEDFFDDHAGKTLLFAKWSQATGMPAMLAAGASKMSYKRFMFFNFIGTIPKSLILIGIGYYFGAFYPLIDHYISEISIVVIVCAGAFLVWSYFFRK